MEQVSQLCVFRRRGRLWSRLSPAGTPTLVPEEPPGGLGCVKGHWQVRGASFLFPQPGDSPAEPTLPGDPGLKKLVRKRQRCTPFLLGLLGPMCTRTWREGACGWGEIGERWECRDLQEAEGVAPL